VRPLRGPRESARGRRKGRKTQDAGGREPLLARKAPGEQTGHKLGVSTRKAHRPGPPGPGTGGLRGGPKKLKCRASESDDSHPRPNSEGARGEQARGQTRTSNQTNRTSQTARSVKSPAPTQGGAQTAGQRAAREQKTGARPARTPTGQRATALAPPCASARSREPPGKTEGQKRSGASPERWGRHRANETAARGGNEGKTEQVNRDNQSGSTPAAERGPKGKAAGLGSPARRTRAAGGAATGSGKRDNTRKRAEGLRGQWGIPKRAVQERASLCATKKRQKAQGSEIKRAHQAQRTCANPRDVRDRESRADRATRETTRKPDTRR